MSASNDYIWNHNYVTYLASEGYLGNKLFGLLSGSISIVRKVEVINISHKYEVRVNGLLLYYKIHDCYSHSPLLRNKISRGGDKLTSNLIKLGV